MKLDRREMAALAEAIDAWLETTDAESFVLSHVRGDLVINGESV